MKKTRLAKKIVSILLKDHIHYPSRLLVDTMVFIARCGILLLLYWYVFNLRGGEINGASFLVVAWSILFYFIFSIFHLRDISRQIMRDVQTGNVEVLFSKPVSYLWYRMWWQVGSGLYSFLVITVIGSGILALTIGIPETLTIGIFIPSFLLVFFFGTLLSLALYSIVGLLAFWIEDINPVFWMVDKSVMILGGSYLPLALFPDFMYKLAVYSPFGAVKLISHIAYEGWARNWYLHLGIQIFWTSICMLLMWFIYTLAKKKVSVNGG